MDTLPVRSPLSGAHIILCNGIITLIVTNVGVGSSGALGHVTLKISNIYFFSSVWNCRKSDIDFVWLSLQTFTVCDAGRCCSLVVSFAFGSFLSDNLFSFRPSFVSPVASDPGDGTGFKLRELL